MVEVVVRDVEPGDIDILLANMRECDRLEVAAAVGEQNVERVLRVSVRMSFYAKTALANGKLANMFGVTPLSTVLGEGCPWLLGTNEMDKHPRAVVRHCRHYIAPMLALFPHLVNHVDARNIRSIAWLSWLGFKIHAPAPYGVQGKLFRKFEMRA